MSAATLLTLACLLFSPSAQVSPEEMVLVKGDLFEMGDLFDEGVQLASPVHEVLLSDYYLARCEVTVEEFAAFVSETGYLSSAETVDKPASDCGMGPPEKPDAYTARLAGRGCFVAGPGGSWNWVEEACWREPQFEQGPRDPVTCLSWIDAVSYCNWLSEMAGLPVAYDLRTGELLDAQGEATLDVTEARGYRLPTEAEWEFAARERGLVVRYGNGKDVARIDEINFNPCAPDSAGAEEDGYRARTLPVGSLPANALGLHDMSGNAWEWCSDFLDRYGEEAEEDPYQAKGEFDLRRAARGGTWATDAGQARACARIGWLAYDRCNNMGFRIARSR
jgi:formylglycine-generating enzyme required for sulfatase activity